jgi:hypothetical protein
LLAPKEASANQSGGKPLHSIRAPPEIDYATLAGGLHMFPRRDGLLLGGTFERGVWDLAPDAEAETRIVAGHAAMFKEMR